MRNVIRADLGRIFRKPSFYIIVVLTLVFLATRKQADTAADQIDNMKYYLNSLILFCVSIPIFLGVYSDDFKSGSMINLIGKGLSRKKVVIAKLLDVTMVLTAFYSVAYIVAVIKNEAAGVAVTPKQNLALLGYVLFCVLRGVGFFALASFVVFATWSTSGGMAVLLITVSISRIALLIVQRKFTLPIYDYSFDGLLESAYAKFAVGSFGWHIIPALVLYVGGAVFLTMLLFDRREIDL